MAKQAKPKPKREVVRERPRNIVWEWVEARFFGGHAVGGQLKECGKAAAFFTEKALHPDELDRRCKRYIETFKDFPLTLHALEKHIDFLAEPTPAEKDRDRRMAEMDIKRRKWLADRIEGRKLCQKIGHAFPRAITAGIPDICGRCGITRKELEDNEARPRRDARTRRKGG